MWLLLLLKGHKQRYNVHKNCDKIGQRKQRYTFFVILPTPSITSLERFDVRWMQPTHIFAHKLFFYRNQNPSQFYKAIFIFYGRSNPTRHCSFVSPVLHVSPKCQPGPWKPPCNRGAKKKKNGCNFKINSEYFLGAIFVFDTLSQFSGAAGVCHSSLSRRSSSVNAEAVIVSNVCTATTGRKKKKKKKEKTNDPGNYCLFRLSQSFVGDIGVQWEERDWYKDKQTLWKLSFGNQWILLWQCYIQKMGIL